MFPLQATSNVSTKSLQTIIVIAITDDQAFYFLDALFVNLAIPAGQVYITELSPSGIGRDDTTFSSPSLNAPALPLTGYHIETGYFTTNTGTRRTYECLRTHDQLTLR